MSSLFWRRVDASRVTRESWLTSDQPVANREMGIWSSLIVTEAAGAKYVTRKATDEERAASDVPFRCLLVEMLLTIHFGSQVSSATGRPVGPRYDPHNVLVVRGLPLRQFVRRLGKVRVLGGRVDSLADTALWTNWGGNNDLVYDREGETVEVLLQRGFTEGDLKLPIQATAICLIMPRLLTVYPIDLRERPRQRHHHPNFGSGRLIRLLNQGVGA